jgi:hypothetical protein
MDWWRNASAGFARDHSILLPKVLRAVAVLCFMQCRGVLPLLSCEVSLSNFLVTGLSPRSLIDGSLTCPSPKIQAPSRFLEASKEPRH